MKPRVDRKHSYKHTIRVERVGWSLQPEQKQWIQKLGSDRVVIDYDAKFTILVRFHHRDDLLAFKLTFNV